MLTGYGPYDMHQIELVKHDQQRQAKAFCARVTVEGVAVSIKRGAEAGSSHPLRLGILPWLRALGAALTRPAESRPLTGRSE